MDQSQYSEMVQKINEYDAKSLYRDSNIYVFGHCEASLAVIDELMQRGYKVKGILDNSDEKIGIKYKDVPVVKPITILNTDNSLSKSVVFLATRFYEQMNKQLREIGFAGDIIKLVDYNTYSEYSLSEATIAGKRERLEIGVRILNELKQRFDNSFLIFCPFNALGDVYYCLAFLPEFMRKRGVSKFALCVSSSGGREVAEIFGVHNIAVLEQKELDAAIQAAIYTEDKDSFIAHQDRPYVINLHKALHIRKIPLEEIYKTGVYGLDIDTKAAAPTKWTDYSRLNDIPLGKSAILSPYAKSVISLPDKLWASIVEDLTNRGYYIYTNVFGDEKPLSGTAPISPKICELKSLVERAGLFIGIRSGLCDILRTAGGRKIALFPDYYYGDTKWKAIDMYVLPEFENVVVYDDYKWRGLEAL